jgi:hypothetical protein
MRTPIRWLIAALAVVVILQAAPSLFSSLLESRVRGAEVERAITQATEKPNGPPPLIVDKSAPLLLDDPAEGDKTNSQATAAVDADTLACFVCHANFKTESLAQGHAKAKMGCIDCHGKSYAHRNDENNTTPPERMYARDQIDDACRQCHPSHDVAAAKVAVLALQRGLSQTDPKAIVCTDCHGHHRLAQRTVRWDKKTGKLLPRVK